MRKEKLNNYGIHLINNSTNKIKQTPELPSLPAIVVATGSRCSGKTQFMADMIRKYRQGGSFDVIKIISPTFESNEALYNTIVDDTDEDVYKNGSTQDFKDFLQYVSDEADEFNDFKKKVKLYKELQKQLRNTNLKIEDINPSLLEIFYDEETGEFKKPEPKYKDENGNARRPSIGLFLDDCMSSELMKGQNRIFTNAMIKHRHWKNVGYSVFLAVQAFKASSGLAKPIRTNMTCLVCFKTHSKKELESIMEEVSGDVDPEDLMEAYEYATEQPHSALLIDMKPRKEHPSGLRHNLDEFLIFD
jgi:flavodoxin